MQSLILSCIQGNAALRRYYGPRRTSMNCNKGCHYVGTHMTSLMIVGTHASDLPKEVTAKKELSSISSNHRGKNVHSLRSITGYPLYIFPSQYTYCFIVHEFIESIVLQTLKPQPPVYQRLVSSPHLTSFWPMT